jgi:hypothetical protein
MQWLYFKIYAKNVENWYYRILNEVVEPFTQRNEQLIDKFFFFHYVENYGVCSDGSIEFEPNCEHKFEARTLVRYVRFRARAKDEDIRALEESLQEIVRGSEVTLETEKCQFDLNADLGGRFGQQRRELTVNYLDAFAKMVLSLLMTNNQLEDGGKPYSAVHLIHNMLGSNISVACANCGEINQVRLVTGFQCQKCRSITVF